MFGHSAGGFTAGDQPFLLLSAGDHGAAADPLWQEFLVHQRGPAPTRHLPDGEHFSYTDYRHCSAHSSVNTYGKAEHFKAAPGSRFPKTGSAALCAFFLSARPNSA